MSDTRFGLLSGAVWGLAAYLSIGAIGRVWPPLSTLLQFAAVGACVGLATTVALRRVRLTGAVQIAVVSLCSLLAAGAAFGMTLSVMGFVAALLAGLAQPVLLTGILIAPIYWVWGLVASGLIVVLWPLSALNHWWLGRLRLRVSVAS